jgi:hypothetical protein
MPTVISIADKHKNMVREKVLKFFKDFARQTKIDDLERLDINSLLSILYKRLNDMDREMNKSDFMPILDVVFQEAGNNIINVLPKGSFLSKYRFDIFYDTTFDVYKRFRVKTTKDIVNDTVSAVKQAIERAINEKRSNEEILYEFKHSIGLNRQQENAVNNYKKALISGSLQSLKYENRDKSKDNEIISSIVAGALLSRSKVNSLVNAYRQRSIEYRANLIAETETLKYASAGEYESIIQAGMEEVIELNGLKKFWVTQRDERVRANHIAIPLMNNMGVDIWDYFQTPLGPMRYPRDENGAPGNIVNCRCYLKYNYTN